MGFTLAGNDLRLDIDGYLRLPQSVRVNPAKYVQIQYENMQLSSEPKIKSTHLLINNWFKEKWVPADIACDGKVLEKQIKTLIHEFKGDIRALNESNVDTNTYKIKSEVNADDFLKGKKLNLNFKKFELEDPVHIHFEFDD